MRVLGVSMLRGYRPSQSATNPALVGLLTSDQGLPGLLVALLLLRLSRKALATMAKRTGYPVLLGYSGGAVPELHRVPCLSTLPDEAADHQRTCHQNIAEHRGVVKQATGEL